MSRARSGMLVLVSSLRCLWSCSCVGNVCPKGQSRVRWHQKGPSWASWPCSPPPRRCWRQRSPRTPEPAPGSAHSWSKSTTHHPLWTDGGGERTRRGGGGGLDRERKGEGMRDSRWTIALRVINHSGGAPGVSSPEGFGQLTGGIS